MPSDFHYPSSSCDLTVVHDTLQTIEQRQDFQAPREAGICVFEDIFVSGGQSDGAEGIDEGPHKFRILS